MDNRVNEYLETISSPVKRAKVRSTLLKHYNTSRGLKTEAAIVLDAIDSGNSRLTYSSMYGKKRDGMRLLTKPKWSIWSGDTGTDISKIGATFANFILGDSYDMAAMTNDADEKYRKDHADNEPGKIPFVRW